jgi:hypothetical protein
MELVGVALPEGDLETMAECIVEEFVMMGLDDDALLLLFKDPYYRTTHGIYRRKGEEYVRGLIEQTRTRGGIADEGGC